MKKIAIIGSGPTGVYTFFSLLKNRTLAAITVFEQGSEAGVGMPYCSDNNSTMMLANIASIEIPPLFDTYIDWLRRQSKTHLSRYGVDIDSLHIRQFLPRILLGEYFRDQFLQLVTEARRCGFKVEVHESCKVTDINPMPEGVLLQIGGRLLPEYFDLAVIATGHVWPDENAATRTYFPSPWTGLMEAKIPPCRLGVLGTSLSGIDATMAVVAQHGEFIEKENQPLQFRLFPNSETLHVTLMSRSGILPEADFFCPIPYEPLRVATDVAIEYEINAGSDGLLDRVFSLISKEITLADPVWSAQISLRTMNVEDFSKAWFAGRHANDPFRWAEANLQEVERNKRDRRTIPWRYTILRLHEPVQEIVQHLTEQDRVRFGDTLVKVFVDNYAAIPSQSIRRLLALREAGLVSIMALGSDYRTEMKGNLTSVIVDNEVNNFDVFIDARGQTALKTKDLPFPTLRKLLEAAGDDIPDVGDDYTLRDPAEARGRIAFGALPYLMHDQPFIQGLTACAEIGAAMAKAFIRPAIRTRRRLPFVEG
ncbi:hypothetical protein KP22_01725 [Pectobacterium betavasculorum]|uniref:FAD-dependent urate hydroxylase HpyO/Asp monooxygenase CreE-like FAD/NAD(P)-binding domain-containing protein n=1 Tax=Pectobacterium betavasculorum TaxID=55207 RepID=A0A093RVH7_9GAMM|nr:FAD-NAD(P)-binding protein [Pectobacterium betavasculorum]KFX06835.1 hypothetical protein KP22_01725 [Pectobacterium betavasculorum]KFX21117.1 hypothetical protein JV35_07940 [Pectobacterium betavasculorum]